MWPNVHGTWLGILGLRAQTSVETSKQSLTPELPQKIQQEFPDTSKCAFS